MNTRSRTARRPRSMRPSPPNRDVVAQLRKHQDFVNQIADAIAGFQSGFNSETRRGSAAAATDWGDTFTKGSRPAERIPRP